VCVASWNSEIVRKWRPGTEEEESLLLAVRCIISRRVAQIGREMHFLSVNVLKLPKSGTEGHVAAGHRSPA